MFVSVLDSDRAPVEGLATGDFLVEEDGVEREVLRVGRATAPMQVAVLVDTSGPAAFATADVRNGLETFVSRVIEDNEVALVTFGGRPRILIESTDEVDRLRDGIGRIFAVSTDAAYLLDALLETARGFERRKSQRPVIVIVSSEGIDYSSHDSSQVLEALQTGGVATHALVLKGNTGVPRDVSLLGRAYQRELVLQQGPQSTGGSRRDLLTSSATEEALNQLAGVLTSQYEIVYARPASLIPPEEIRVRMRREDLTAHGTPARRTGD